MGYPFAVVASSLKEILSEMPDAGDDRDFERIEDDGRAVPFAPSEKSNYAR
jgi:hypothetical protein